MQPYARRTLVILLTCAAAALIVPAITAPGLTGSITVLWSLGGRPGGSIVRWAAVLVLAAIPLIFAAVTAIFARLNVVPVMRLGFASVGVLATVLATLHSAYILSVNAGYGSGADIPVAVTVLAAAAEVAIGVLAMLYIAMAPVDEADELPTQRPGLRAPLWRGSAAARRPIYNSMGFFVIGFASLVIGTDAGGLTLCIGMIVGGLFILSLTAIVVEIDDREFRVHYFGGTRWPATHLAVSSIREVEVVDVDPPKSGGWGYRGNLRRQGNAAVNIRRGPGLRLKLDGGRRFLVTVSDPESGARVLRQFVTAQ
jgi:hypothetical protein